MTTSNLLYSTSTNEEAIMELSDELQRELNFAAGEIDPQGYEDYLYDSSWCFICARPTDHRGEHDDLVEQGLAEYDPIYPIVR